jgi:hypothetical protein
MRLVQHRNAQFARLFGLAARLFPDDDPVVFSLTDPATLAPSRSSAAVACSRLIAARVPVMT